jgi:methylthioribose-1-phosphate isomerase
VSGAPEPVRASAAPVVTTKAEPLPPTVAWRGGEDGELALLDQTVLPHRRRVLAIRDVDAAIEAIVQLRVRGAPAIGVAAAYAVVLGVRAANPAPSEFCNVVADVCARLGAARPTAVNLRWALDRSARAAAADPTLAALLREARAIHAEDAAMCERMGRFGAPLVPHGGCVLTHCNTGRLATAGDGTALAVLFRAWQDGVRFSVLADETRPLLQGARLTALELAAAGIPVELCCDGAAAGLIARGAVQLVLVGADRIAANGDFANKVGTYGLALACAAHGVPFYAVAPRSTFDLAIAGGQGIPIEERDATEVTALGGMPIAAAGVGARNPAFDVTPARLVAGIVTDRGILRPPYETSIKELFAAGR